MPYNCRCTHDCQCLLLWDLKSCVCKRSLRRGRLVDLTLVMARMGRVKFKIADSWPMLSFTNTAYLTCSHLLQEAVHQTVSVIFEDPGVEELLVKLYQKGELFLRFLSILWALTPSVESIYLRIVTNFQFGSILSFCYVHIEILINLCRTASVQLVVFSWAFCFAVPFGLFWLYHVFASFIFLIILSSWLPIYWSIC